MKLAGSVCIVTGSATGVGAACAVMLAGKGARVVVNYSRSEREARETMVACMATGNEALLVQGDVANDADCRRMADAALERWGRIDGLVNNAGITKFANPADLDLLDAADFHRLLDVNVIGAFQMIRAVVPAMRAQGQGAIVNVSSNATAIGGGSSLAYTASKGALNAMTLTLARALGPEIRVNAVSPGVIDSRWLRDGVGEAAFTAVRDRYADAAALARVAQPEDVAEPVVWLLEGADFITGEILMVDGGVRLGAGLAKPVRPKMIRQSSLLAFAGCLAASVAAHATECGVSAISALNVHGAAITSAEAKTDGDGHPLCDVKGTLTTTGEGAPDGTARFEVKLPTQWNGKFLFLGVGGLGGNLFPSVTRADILAAGNFATAITDTGHEGPNANASWALVKPGVTDDAKLTDYYFRAVHEVAVTAKQLVQGYFGKSPAKSYFDGCSNGGRQALMEASRYPDDFDGIVAGAPFMDIKAILAGTRLYQHLLKPSAYIPAALLPAVDRAMLASCDAADGVKDGLIQNPAQCALDLKSLICKPGEGENCLNADQAGALETYFTATRDETGRYLFPGSANTDLQGAGMNVWSVGMTAPDDVNAVEPWAKQGLDHAPLAWQFADSVIKYVVERDPNFDLRNFRFDAASIRLFAERTGAGNADDPARLMPFIANGKKLLLYHGFSDPALAPLRTIKFYEDLAAANGGYERLQGNVRLFMAPDVQHCGGGPGPNSFDTLTALVDWVEQGKAPDSIPARHFEGNNPNHPVDRTMPLCPFPTAATYKGQGDVDSAENWSCLPNRRLLEIGKAGADAGMSVQKQE